MKWKKPVLGMMLALTVCSVNSGTVSASPSDESVIYLDAADGKQVDLSQVLSAVSDKQVVYFGEYHDSQPAHDAEMSVMEGLYAEHGDRLVLSLEMFERDVQGVLDAYLNGDISEEEFLAKSRPWENYVQAYRPMIEFAKEHHLPVLASNIPRRMAAVVAKTGSLETAAPEDRKYRPAGGIYPASFAYRKRFMATMEQFRVHGREMPKEKMQQMYRAQCLKDDTMAHTIADYLKAHPESVVYQVNGGFHSDGGQGVPWKLDLFRPDTAQAVLSTVHYRPRRDKIDEVWQNNRREGDFLVLETAHREP